MKLEIRRIENTRLTDPIDNQCHPVLGCDS